MKGEKPIRCPRCKGLRSCAECDGLGEVTCPACDGLGEGCDNCQDTGRSICLTCDGSGQCPRCKGEGTIQLDDSLSTFPYFWA